MASEKNKIYCSLDIETSGFDPLKNEILEVGFAFFTVTEAGVKITEEWTKVFKPTKEVPASILSLTGISQKELEAGAEFAESRGLLQEKLGEAVIVGHNVIFDIKFLEANGIKFSGAVLDTLDLSQFILPTHHSYNLENLMHKFSVSHKDAHRALADSKAALVVLEKLLGIFQGFPEELKEKVLEVAEGSGMPWQDMLKVKLPAAEQKDRVIKKPAESVCEPVKFEGGKIYNFPVGKSCIEDVVKLLGMDGRKFLFVVPKQSQALSLWKQGLAVAEFLPANLFNEKKFKALLKKKDKSPEEARFVLKVLVWLHTNWQTKSIVDLNLSFFGGQFKSLISGSEIKEEKSGQIVCMDLETFAEYSSKGLFADRFVVVAGLSEFEAAVSSNIGVKVSWGYLNFLLKSYYNPELGVGNRKFEEKVLEALTVSDLFFGLVNAFFQTNPPTFQYLRVSPENFNDDRFIKIQQAADNFHEKLEEINKVLESDAIRVFLQNLRSFFEDHDNRVKWIELAQGRCVFFSTPLDIAGLVKEHLKPYEKVAFADSFGAPKLIKYFTARLGLGDFRTYEIKPKAAAKQLPLFGEGLIGRLKSVGKDVKIRKVSCFCQSQAASYEKIADILGKNSFPAAVLFGSALQIREFHEQNYEQLKEKAALLAQSQSGGSSKLFHNFSIHKNSLLLATDKFILKSINSFTALEPVETLPVKTLVLCHLPFEQFTHPYQEALAQRFENSFEDFSLPRAVYNLHRLLQFFNTPVLENIYICDAKLSKGYASSFKDYIKLIPNVEMASDS